MNLKELLGELVKVRVWLARWSPAALIIAVCVMVVAGCGDTHERTVRSVKQGIERGDSLYRQQKYIDALDMYISQLGLLRHNESDSLYLTILSRIGLVYDIYEDSARALYYYEKVLTDPEAKKYDELYSGVLVKMVVGYFNSGEKDKARHYYGQQLAHPFKDRQMATYYQYTNGGLVESMEEHPGRALEKFRQSLAYCEAENMEPVFKVPVMFEMATAFGRLHEPDSVRRYLNEARDISEREELDSYAADSYNLLYRFYKNQGDSVRAARYLELYSSVSDSIALRNKLDTASLRLLQSHDVQAREEISTLNQRIDFQAKTIFLVLAFCAVLAAFAIYTRRQHLRIKASYKMLIAKNDEIFELEDKTVLPQTSETQAQDETPQTPNPLFERINEALGNIELISRPSFSLADLSQEVGSNTKYVSALINEVYKKNFRAIVNERRIKEATRRLSDTERYGECSIAEIAESLGYSSSTVFINAFKKVIGMTPAVYRRYRK